MSALSVCLFHTHPLRDPKFIKKKHIRRAFGFYLPIYMRGQKMKKRKHFPEIQQKNDVFVNTRVF